MWNNICSGAYAKDVKSMYTSVPGHIADCSELLWGIYTGIVVSFAHELICIYVCMYVVLEGTICYEDIHGNSMLNGK